MPIHFGLSATTQLPAWDPLPVACHGSGSCGTVSWPLESTAATWGPAVFYLNHYTSILRVLKVCTGTQLWERKAESLGILILHRAPTGLSLTQLTTVVFIIWHPGCWQQNISCGFPINLSKGKETKVRNRTSHQLLGLGCCLESESSF